MSTAMETYLSDSLSLQDMLDIDIKSEIDILVGGHNDLSGFNFSDLPSLDLEESNDMRWYSANSNHSNESFNYDLSNDDVPTMVNPNAVMPLTQHRSPSPLPAKSHFTFSPSCIKIGSLKTTEQSVFKKNIINKMSNYENIKKPLESKPIPRITPIIAKPIVKTVTKPSPIITFKSNATSSLLTPVFSGTIGNIRTVTTAATMTGTPRKQQYRNIEKCEPQYPKPAYSYSCLIAMALKNSVTGSLPVSEIYSFMCRHFPYFKTAPNGWKNSVRHNLSLNKCFEKIEKPAINGAQRKGCLWAMNPAKIVKMDEEVQKWSRKDPNAIRRAMVNPENLEFLERGELKFTYEEADVFGDSCGSAESEEGSDNEEIEVEAEIEQTFDGDSNFFGIQAVKSEDEDIDIEESDEHIYEENDLEDDKEVLRMEMELAQKELLQYQQVSSNKRRKIYFVQQRN